MSLKTLYGDRACQLRFKYPSLRSIAFYAYITVLTNSYSLSSRSFLLLPPLIELLFIEKNSFAIYLNAPFRLISNSMATLQNAVTSFPISVN